MLFGKIQAPGYLEAFNSVDKMAIEAYNQTRWIGSNVPHIDPKKEVEAVRAALGPKYADVPLTTGDKATESLNNGDYNENIIISSKELEDADNALEISSE